MPKTIKLPVEKATVLSTGHVTKQDGSLLESFSSGRGCRRPGTIEVLGTDTRHSMPRMESHTYGWFVFVCQDADLQEQAKALALAGFSEEFVALYRTARKQGIQIIDLDRDGEEVDGLPRFDW